MGGRRAPAQTDGSAREVRPRATYNRTFVSAIAPLYRAMRVWGPSCLAGARLRTVWDAVGIHLMRINCVMRPSRTAGIKGSG